MTGVALFPLTAATSPSMLPVRSKKTVFVLQIPDSLPISLIRDDASVRLTFLPFLLENCPQVVVSSDRLSALCALSNVV
jgi:hypothetical protein